MYFKRQTSIHVHKPIAKNFIKFSESKIKKKQLEEESYFAKQLMRLLTSTIIFNNINC